MADKWPLATGNWSDAANWNDGTLPVDGDTIYLDGKTLTIDLTVNLPSSIIRSDARSGGTTAGISILPNGQTVTIGEWRAGSHNPFRFGNGCTVNGDIYGGPTVPGRAIEYAGSGLTINGNCYGGSGGFSGTNNSTAAYVSGGVITINGNCYGGVQGPGAMAALGGVITINGDCYGGTSGVAAAARVTVGAVTINGNCYGSSGAPGSLNEASGNLICNGEAVASDAGVAGIAGSSILGVTTVGSVRSGSTGAFGAVGFFKFKDANSQIYHFRADGVSQQFADVATVGEPPATSNVRNGVSYHYGSLTGTLAVPLAQYVSLGVAVDDTVGTLSFDDAAIRAAIGLASANLDTQLATVDSNVDAIKAKTDQLTYTIAGQVDANLLTGGSDATAANQAAILAAVDAIESGTNGNGQYQINLTAAVGATAVRNVRVSIDGTDTFTHTGTLGTGELNVDAGTYTLIVTPPAGYEDVADVEVTVTSADEDVDIELVATTVTVAEAPYCATTLQVLSQYEGSAAGVAVTIEFIKWLPDADPTGVVVNKLPAITSDADGLVSANLFQLAKYKASYRVGFEDPKVVEFSTPAAGTYAVVDP